MSLWFEKSKRTKISVCYFDRIKEGVHLESHEDYDKFIDVTLSKRCTVVVAQTQKVNSIYSKNLL